MSYFVTGASGFIGRRLVRRLLRRRGRIYVLVREDSAGKVEALRRFWGVRENARVIPVTGDLTQPQLGLDPATVARLKGRIRHFYHLAAVYDLEAPAALLERVNVEGTRHAVALAGELEVGCFHLVSSIAAAGLYEGVFREDMFEEAENLEIPYYRTKHASEAIVRQECRRPWRVYRPALVVGDSRSGEMDKIDGPYYFFKLIQKLRRALPEWMPVVGPEGGRINLVPVDFVVEALDHIAHARGLNGRCFHLVDPNPHRVADVLNIFARAAHAPRMGLRINGRMFEFVPALLRSALTSLEPVRRVADGVRQGLGLPPGVLHFINYPTRFDCREAERALAGSGIAVPPLESYAHRLWDYWERHLDPDLHVDHSLAGQVYGKVVVVTGASSGIGRATALKLGGAGARVVIVARGEEKLEATREAIEAAGGTASAYSADLADLEQCEALAGQVLADHGQVDILVNNAGRSIRRSVEHSLDRFHDFQRLMQLNYFGALRLTLSLLPAMAERGQGQVINISSIGVLSNAPRFSGYVASKAALDAFTRCAASEYADTGVHFTTINMPLVRTPMSAPTRIYQQLPALAPEEAADLVVQAIVHRPTRIATRLGVFAQLMHAVAPRFSQFIMNSAFHMFPESAAALGREHAAAEEPPTPEQISFAQMTRGIHL